MSWICSKCETENPDRLKVCEVCDSPREFSPLDILKERLKEKYPDAAYKNLILYNSSLLEAADNGNSIDQFHVGEWFFNKRNRTHHLSDYERIASIWYTKAARQGHTPAQYMLALCYEEGHGVPLSKVAAIKWYKAAADKGDEKARKKYVSLKYDSETYKYVLIYIYSIFEKADRGDKNAQYELGVWFSKHKSQSAYRKEAVKWFAKAANQGNYYAMYKLGECYENGTGIERNYSKALTWYKKAANRDYTTACQKLARCYLYGNLVRKDVVKAIRWFTYAKCDISSGDLCQIGYAYESGNGIAANKGKAFEYYAKAAERDNATAQYHLGVCYENGTGVTKDYYEAKKWYERAASKGHDEAQQGLTRVKAKIEKEKQKKNIIEMINLFIGRLLCGGIYGGFGYYIIFESNELSKLGVQIPEAWLNAFPANLIICLIIAFIIASICIKND